jgi:hypothetical protein
MLTLFVTLATVAMTVLAIGQDRQVHFKKLSFRDVIFTTNLLFDVTVRSKAQCAQRCSSDCRCVTFTFSPGSCRGHAPFRVSNPVTSAKNNTLVYQMEMSGEFIVFFLFLLYFSFLFFFFFTFSSYHVFFSFLFFLLWAWLAHLVSALQGQ